MSQKQKFQEILAKLRSWADSNGNEELAQHLNDLENEINASFTAQADTAQDPPGGDVPDAPDVP